MTMTIDRLAFDQPDRMRKAIRAAGRTQADVADELRVDRSSVSNWINGHTTPRRRDLEDFAAILDVDVEWLRTGRLTDAPMFSAGNDTTPAEAGAVSLVRPEGFEPPTVCSVALGLDAALVLALIFARLTVTR